jgi:YfiH family protein
MTLPEPNPVFRWKRETWGHTLCCRGLEAFAQHLFTTKQLQLPPPDMPERAWNRVAGALRASPDRLLRVRQVHGRDVRIVRSDEFRNDAGEVRPEADAIVSNAPGAVLAVQVADCIPMLMVDARTGAAAAVHAGWRGTCVGVATAAINALKREFGTVASDLRVALGPSIGPCCYQVGPELIEAFRQAGASDDELARWFQRTGEGEIRLDMWAANRDQLIVAGVKPEHVFPSGLCTRTHADVFDSYRADGPRAGRSIAAIQVPHI